MFRVRGTVCFMHVPTANCLLVPPPPSVARAGRTQQGVSSGKTHLQKQVVQQMTGGKPAWSLGLWREIHAKGFPEGREATFFSQCGWVWTGLDGSGTAPEPVGACVLLYVLYLCQDVVQKEFKTVRFLLSSNYFSSHLHLSLLQFQLAIK